MTSSPSSTMQRSRSVWGQSRFRLRDAQLPEVADVVIAGAGIAGMSVAVRLAQAGLDVVVLDAISPAAGTTGHSSAKISILHGLNAHRIADSNGIEMAAHYLKANQSGLSWIEEQIRANGIECGWERQPGVSYVTQTENASLVDAEVATFISAGITAHRVQADLPYETAAAIKVDDQGQLDPVRFIDALVEQLISAGGRLVTGIRATGVDDSASGATVRTTGGDIACGWFVVATGLPFLDRGLFFARTEPQSSYVIACDVRNLPPTGMYLSGDGPTRSLRTASVRQAATLAGRR